MKAYKGDGDRDPDDGTERGERGWPGGHISNMECSGAAKPDRTSLGSGVQPRNAVSHRRPDGMGATRAATHAPCVRAVLPVYGKRGGGTRSYTRSICARVPHAEKLSFQ